MTRSRHVVVTGAASGIGHAVAARFAAAGDSVTGVDVRHDVLAAVMDRLAGDHGVTTRALVADLALPDCAAVVDRARAEGGDIDVLVNAAGIYPATPLARMTAASWSRVQDVNVRAPVLLTIALAAQATEAQRRPCVVNISSGAATRARPGAAHYCASKAALEMATKACAVELAGQGIRVNAVAPGFVDVDSPVNPVSADYAAKVSANPLGRAGRADEIAAAVYWLSGDDAGFATGSVLRVDGGATAGTTALPPHYPEETDLQVVAAEGELA